VKPQLPREGRGGLIRCIPTRFYSVLQAIQYQGCRDGAGQPAAAKLTVGLDLDLDLPSPNRRGSGARDKPALMQDAHAECPGYELFVGAKVVDQGTIQICGELRYLFRAHLP
jgi:hypothetical protein